MIHPSHVYILCFGNGQDQDFFQIMRRVSGYTLPAQRHHLVKIIYKMMCYVSKHVFKTKMQYMKHNIRINKTIVQLCMIFSPIPFYVGAINQGREK